MKDQRTLSAIEDNIKKINKEAEEIKNKNKELKKELQRIIAEKQIQEDYKTINIELDNIIIEEEKKSKTNKKSFFKKICSCFFKNTKETEEPKPDKFYNLNKAFYNIDLSNHDITNNNIIFIDSQHKEPSFNQSSSKVSQNSSDYIPSTPLGLNHFVIKNKHDFLKNNNLKVNKTI